MWDRGAERGGRRPTGGPRGTFGTGVELIQKRRGLPFTARSVAVMLARFSRYCATDCRSPSCARSCRPVRTLRYILISSHAYEYRRRIALRRWIALRCLGYRGGALTEVCNDDTFQVSETERATNRGEGAAILLKVMMSHFRPNGEGDGVSGSPLSQSGVQSLPRTVFPQPPPSLDDGWTDSQLVARRDSCGKMPCSHDHCWHSWKNATQTPANNRVACLRHAVTQTEVLRQLGLPRWARYSTCSRNMPLVTEEFA